MKSVGKSRKQIRKELRKQKKINRSIYFKSKNESRAASARASDSQTDHSKLANKSVKGPGKCTKETKRRKSEDLERQRKKEKNRLLKAANLKEDKVIKRLEKQLKLNKRKKETISKSFVSDGLDCILFLFDKKSFHTLVVAYILFTNVNYCFHEISLTYM